MWFPLKEVANFAMLMGALVVIYFISCAADWLTHKIHKYFKEKIKE